MIRSFRHRGAQQFFETGSTRGIDPSWARRLQLRLDRINLAQIIEEVSVPGLDLHELKGHRSGTWAVNLTRNFRVTFRFAEGNAYDVDIEDYH